MNDSWLAGLQRTRNHEGFMRGAQALLALSAVLLVGWQQDWQGALMTVLLGVLASAFTETDDHWSGRIQTQLICLCTFAAVVALACFTVDSPVLMAFTLAVAALVLTLTGALGERYRAIAFGALVLFVYTALGAQGSQEHALANAPYLLGGAAWYALVSLLWGAAWPMPTLRHRLSVLYVLLGDYLQLKSQLLEPVGDIDRGQRRLELAMHSGRVVNALNSAKDCLFSRLGRGAPSPALQEAIHQYLAAQDIHERVSSSHESYVLLATVFARSDALYRCQRVLSVLGQQSHKLADAIRTRATPQHSGTTGRAIEEMQEALRFLEQQGGPAERPLRALLALGGNLTALASVFAGALQHKGASPALELLDREPHTLREALHRIGAELNLRSALMRHALRLALSLLVAFAVMRWTHDPHGYWIVLTVLFVSQPQFGATLERLSQRAMGTVIGLCMGWAIIRLFPGALLQGACTVIAGTVFVGKRQTDPRMGGAAITTLVLLSFHQMGMAQGVIPARLLDTAIGSAIAALAAWLVLPNWQSRHWGRLAARAMRGHAGYLREIVLQYQWGKQDHLAYRLARRNAHNADAALSNAYTAMRNEPPHARLDLTACGRFLLQAHMLLNYLSAMGAHRGDSAAPALDAATCAAAEQLAQQLEALARELEGLQPLAPATPPEASALPQTAALDASPAHWLQVQLQLASQLVPGLRQQLAAFTPRR